MKKLPIIFNKNPKNKNRTTNSLYSYNIKPVTYYKYDEVPSNLSQIIFNDQSISQSTFPTNLKNINSSLIPIDNRYYSTINITKKLPLSRKLNITSTYMSKNDSYYNNRSCPEIEKYLDKKSVIYNYISKKNNKIGIENKSNKSEISKSKINQKIIVDAEKLKMNIHLMEMREKMKKTKFKLYKIIINNRKQTCGLFEKKNDIFNGKLHNYLKSNSFYEKNKKFHRVFHFGKNDLNLGHDFTKHYVEPYNQQKNAKLTSEFVLKLLNDEDKKLIHSDPFFFLKDNKYLYKLTNTKYRSLPYILREEERLKENNNALDEDEDEKDENNNKSSKNSSLNKSKRTKKEGHKKNLKKIIIKKKMKKSQTADDIKFIYDGILLYNKKYIDKIINKDLDRRLKEISKKKDGEIEKEMRDTIIKLNNYKKKDYYFESNNNYYKTYNDKTNSNYFKPYSLRKNSERLLKEIYFQEKRNEKYNKDKSELKTIVKYKKMLENIYKKNNNKEEEK